ncbi:MAG TPA: N-acetylmuramoyl-L-alanine amidase [Candidatus Angelobacter sp.]|nr:N-acetylmuramoyl-L-alanine amidase [Candidatus Angelobacter sp.]
MTRRLPLALLGLLLAACGADAPASGTPTASPSSTAVVTATPSAEPSPAGIGEVIPAPGSGSALYPPNPGAIVVAIEAGHGGCLDWGVPDPQERGPDFSEKAITMAIARSLAGMLAADGVRPLLIRDGDEALAGDEYPALGCEGAPFRDVNGDGMAGFGPDVPEATRTRDELQARLDRANVAGADVLVSIHVDSITDAAGNLLPVARTETFYTDETPWGPAVTEPLAAAVQESLVAAMDGVAGYDRQDRGINAHNLYVVAPPLERPTPERPDPLRQPTRGALMPAILVEVGTITLPEEHELLLTEAGVSAASRGIFEGLAAWLADRPLAGRISVEGREVGRLPAPVAGGGPPFVAEPLPDAPLRLRVTNTGTREWGADVLLVGGWITSAEPYVYGRPAGVEPRGTALPPLAAGESVVVELDPGPPSGPDELAWFSLRIGAENLADHGSPALQLRGAP